MKHKQRTTPKRWIGLIALSVALCLLVGCVSPTPGAGKGIQTLAKAVYPTLTAYPSHYTDEAWEAWYTDRRAQLAQGKGHADGMEDYYQATMTQFLTGKEGENRVYSPLNIYFALAMLAETTGGNSRQQILDLLGVADVETLRAQVKGLWNANYQDDGLATSLLANSLWLDENIDYVQETLDILAENYYASTYRGQAGSAAYNAAIRDWLNENTGGLLEEQAANSDLYSGAALVLASTVYFTGRWEAEFAEKDTYEDTFHAADGDMTVDFMHQTLLSHPVFFGEGYRAVRLSLSEGYAMWLLLPDEEVSLDTVIRKGNIPGHLKKWAKYEGDYGHYEVALSMPKFDVCAQTDLIDGLKNLGVTGVFTSSEGFENTFTSLQDVVVGRATHAARVKVDEEGCEAAAFTVLTADGTAMPEEGTHLDFDLDRPFAFAITGVSQELLFAGAVEVPCS